jgi:hypothetical protein
MTAEPLHGDEVSATFGGRYVDAQVGTFLHEALF